MGEVTGMIKRYITRIEIISNFHRKMNMRNGDNHDSTLTSEAMLNYFCVRFSQFTFVACHTNLRSTVVTDPSRRFTITSHPPNGMNALL
jgi:hypothetical protein